VSGIREVEVIDRQDGKGLGTCGFCAFGGNHELCPAGVASMGGGKVWRCGCGCPQSRQIKCLSCGNREDEWPAHAEIDATTWRCTDLDACAARVETRLASNPTVAMIRAINDQNGDGTATPRLPRVGARPTARPKEGKCLHCGEPTKGGLFLPGHDAAYLSQTVKALAAQEISWPATLEKWQSQGISEALQTKLRRKVEAL
jgi:hypothetical protein